MGAIDLVVQIEAPPAVAAGLQRIGRAGHQVGEPSTGKIFPKYRGDLLEAAVVVRRMLDGAIEETAHPAQPARRAGAAARRHLRAWTRWTVDELHALVTRAEPLPRPVARAARRRARHALRPLPVRRVRRAASRGSSGTAPPTRSSSRNDARVVAVTSGGTIPDRGLYGVFLAGDEGGKGRRVGELDEEMVYEIAGRRGLPARRLAPGGSRRSSRDRVHRHAGARRAGQDAVLARRRARPPDRARAGHRRLPARARADDSRRGGRRGCATTTRSTSWRRATCVAYLAEQREATGALPTDRQLVVERFRDELGDWRVCLLSPFGGRVHAPWAMAIEARLAEQRRRRSRRSGPMTASPCACRRPTRAARRGAVPARPRRDRGRADRRARRRPRCSRPASGRTRRARCCCRAAGPASARRCGCSASGPPTCWRWPAATARSRSSSRPTARSCATSSTCPRCSEVLGGIRSRQIRVASRRDPLGRRRSPPGCCSTTSAAYMYEGDAPLAERRAQALTLDRELLAELLGAEELRELLDPAAIADLELELQGLADGRRARDRRRHPRPAAAGRRPPRRRGRGAQRTCRDLARRAVRASTGPPHRRAPAGRRAALDRDRGRRPATATRSAPARRRAWPRRGCTAAASTAAAGRAAAALGAHPRAVHRGRAGGALGHRRRAACRSALRALVESGALLEGAFRPGGAEHEFADRRGAAQPAPPLAGRACGARSSRSPAEALARFLPAWHGVGVAGGRPRPAARGDHPAGGLPDPGLDPGARRSAARGSATTRRACSTSCGAAGEVVWIGRGPLGRDDGRMALFRRDRAELLASAGAFEPGERPDGAAARRLRAAPRAPRRVASSVRCGWRSRRAHRRRAARRAVGPGLVRRGHQRHLRRAAGPDAAALALAHAAGPGRPGGTRSAARRRPLVAGCRPGRGGPLADRSAATPARVLAARAARRRHARGGAGRGLAGGFAAVYPCCGRWRRRGARGAATSWTASARPSSRCPVPVDRLRAARDEDGTRARGRSCWRPPTRPSRMAPRCPGRAGGGRAAAAAACGGRVRRAVDGPAALYLERGGKSLLTLPGGDDPELAAMAVASLPALLQPGGRCASWRSSARIACRRRNRAPPTPCVPPAFGRRIAPGCCACAPEAAGQRARSMKGGGTQSTV